MAGIRRDRSRSPSREVSGRHRDKHQESITTDMSTVMNQMMMTNMYSQGNMLMPNSVYGNMMMPNTMMTGAIMQPPSIDMMAGSGIEMIPQTSVDMSVIGTQAIGASSGPPGDINMMGVMLDPSLIAMYSNMNCELMLENKEIILNQCKLIPPERDTPQHPRRERPPGCRTIFVGGLPDKIRESVVREIFEPYGRIQILRLSKKNFCHIRFDKETCVDAAMAISGYKVKLTFKDNDNDKNFEDDSHATHGLLHVDYALSRDDQNEYERRQRQAHRVQHSQIQQFTPPQEINCNVNHQRSPSPVRTQPFSNAAITQLTEKIKNEEQFATSLPTLIAWLERGECSKKYSNQFYSMIQATNSHIRRLFNEKMQLEEELHNCRERVKNNIQIIIDQLAQVAKVFIAATHQRVWDHFTKPQRKNIETWQKITQEFNTLKKEFYEKLKNEEMEYNNTSNSRNSEISDEIQQLKKENESLQFQLEAYKNEVYVIKNEAQKEMEKFKAQFIARQALIQSASDRNEPPLPAPIQKPPPPPPLPGDLKTTVHLKAAKEAGCGEAKLIGVMSAFLQVHPKGASLDYVVSYVRALFPEVSQGTVHHILQKHGDVFQCSTTGVGANIEHRWSFVAFIK